MTETTHQLPATRRTRCALLCGALLAALTAPVTAMAEPVTDSDGDNIPDTEDVVSSAGAIVSTGQPARQSSTWRTSTPPERAVDGSYIGTEESDNTHTQADGEPWWEVDLGRTHTIDAINVWNRNSTSASVNARLDGAAVLVSAEPLGDVSFAEAQRRAVWSTVIADAGLIEQLAVPNRIGRYVRVQLPPSGSFLHLAEVDVMGVPGRPNDLDGDLVIDAEDTVANHGTIVSTGRPATQSSTWTGRPDTDASSAVDDVRDGGRDGSQPLAITDDDEPWWEIDLEAWFVIDGLNIYNRTDSNRALLAGAVVMIAETPFGADMGLVAAQGHATYETTIETADALVQLEVPDVTGRYVRIQHAPATTPHLGLAEVDVLASASLGDVDDNGVLDLDDTHYRSAPNVAVDANATQSSSYRSTTPASRAVDGNRDGSAEHLNSHTACASRPWWQVDLGELHTIEEVNVWNRNSTSAAVNARLDGAVVVISAAPLDDLTLEDAIAVAEWTTTIDIAQRVNHFAIPDIVGRYVRVQLPGANCLHLAEVEVYATPGGDPTSGYADDDADGIDDRVDVHVSSRTNVALSASASQSSIWRSTTPAERAIDGNRDGSHEHLNNHTQADGEPWWELDLGDLHTIDSINIWNRDSTSAAVNARLDGAVVIISTEPLGDATFAGAIAAAAWSTTIDTAERVNQFSVPDIDGRYIRVQLPPTGSFLHIAELEAFASPVGS